MKVIHHSSIFFVHCRAVLEYGPGEVLHRRRTRQIQTRTYLSKHRHQRHSTRVSCQCRKVVSEKARRRMKRWIEQEEGQYKRKIPHKTERHASKGSIPCPLNN